MQTRISKYRQLRFSIELEDTNYMFTNFDEWNYIRTHQKEIKKELGCKH